MSDNCIVQQLNRTCDRVNRLVHTGSRHSHQFKEQTEMRTEKVRKPHTDQQIPLTSSHCHSRSESPPELPRALAHSAESGPSSSSSADFAGGVSEASRKPTGVDRGGMQDAPGVVPEGHALPPTDRTVGGSSVAFRVGISSSNLAATGTVSRLP
eukprot:RCo006704